MFIRLIQQLNWKIIVPLNMKIRINGIYLILAFILHII